MSKKYFLTLILIGSSFFSVAANAFLGLGYSKYSHHKANNVVALSSNENRCSGVVIGGSWVLTTADCGQSSAEYVEVNTSWLDPKGKQSPHDYRALVENNNIVPNAQMPDSTNILMKINSAPNVSAFNVLSPAALATLPCKNVDIQIGLNENLYSAVSLILEPESNVTQCMNIDFNSDLNTHHSPGVQDVLVNPPNHDNNNVNQGVAQHGLTPLHILATDGFENLPPLVNLLPKKVMQYWRIGDVIKIYTPYSSTNFADFEIPVGDIEENVATKNGTAGTPYLNEHQHIVAIHNTTLFKQFGVVTVANLVAQQSQWLLNTINAWHYPTQVQTKKKRATITFQSLHDHSIDLFDNLFLDGVDIETITCKTLNGDEVNPMMIHSYDICHMSIYNYSNGEAFIQLSDNEIITVDYGRDCHQGRCKAAFKKAFSGIKDKLSTKHE